MVQSWFHFRFRDTPTDWSGCGENSGTAGGTEEHNAAIEGSDISIDGVGCLLGGHRGKI